MTQSEIHNSNITFKDSQKAFEEAIEKGVLSTDPRLNNYAGNWMYMHTQNGQDEFKNIMNRGCIYI